MKLKGKGRVEATFSAQELVARSIAYLQIGEEEIALNLAERALELDPSLEATVSLVRGNIFASQERFDSANRLANEVLEQNPGNLDALRLKKRCHSWLNDATGEVATTRRILEIAPDIELHSRLLFNLLFLTDTTPESVYEESCHWFSQYGAALRPAAQVYANAADPQRRIRVGYVSPDLRRHPIMKLLPGYWKSTIHPKLMYGFTRLLQSTTATLKISLKP